MHYHGIPISGLVILSTSPIIMTRGLRSFQNIVFFSFSFNQQHEIALGKKVAGGERIEWQIDCHRGVKYNGFGETEVQHHWLTPKYQISSTDVLLPVIMEAPFSR